MRFRSLQAIIPCLCAASLVASPAAAQDLEPARATALAKLKIQLAAAEIVVAADRAGAAGNSNPAQHGADDPVAYRLDAAFALFTTDSELSTDMRLPRPRPEEPRDLVALAYAESADNATDGMTAIEALVQKHAQANDVPPALAQALVQVESSHNPRATGRNGEIGLLQIKPQTARAMGYRGSAKGLYDPETNLAWGMKYLGKAHDLSGGDICGTLLRYNAGLDAKRRSKSSSRFCSKVKSVMAKRA